MRVQEANPILVLSRHATEFNATFPQLRANLDALNGVQLGGLAQQTAAAAKQIGLLAALEAKLKEAKEAKPNLTTEAEIKASNLLIESLENQIKRLNALGVGSDAAQKALAKLREELNLNVKLSQALGQSYDYVKERTETLSKGIKSLLEAGFDPASKTIKGFISDLSKLYPQLELKKVNVAPLAIEPPKVLPMDLTNTPVDAEGISAAYGALTAKLNEKLEPFRAGLLAFNTESEQALNQLKDGLVNGLSGIGQAIGGALFDGASIGAALTSSFAPIIEALALFAEKKGKLYIGLGIADLAIPGLQAQGIAEIAGGTALLLAAGVARAGAGALSSSARPSGGGIGSSISTSPASTPRSYTPTTAPGAATSGPAVTNIHKVQFELTGSTLRGVLNIETDRLGRVVGR